MAVVTFNGPMGSGGVEVGVLAARMLHADYVDRLVLAEAAKRIGSTVAVLTIKEQQNIAMGDRIAYFLRTMLERSAMSGAGGEPYFSPGIEYLPSEEYTDLAAEPLTAAQRLNDQHFADVTGTVITDLAKAGNVVIDGRGSNMILKDMPGVLHVGLVAPLELRVKTIAGREHLSEEDAQKHTVELEKGRVAYYRKFFKVQPDDPALFHLVLNMGTMNPKVAAEIVAHAAQDLASETQS